MRTSGDVIHPQLGCGSGYETNCWGGGGGGGGGADVLLQLDVVSRIKSIYQRIALLHNEHGYIPRLGWGGGVGGGIENPLPYDLAHTHIGRDCHVTYNHVVSKSYNVC